MFSLLIGDTNFHFVLLLPPPESSLLSTLSYHGSESYQEPSECIYHTFFSKLLLFQLYLFNVTTQKVSIDIVLR